MNRYETNVLVIQDLTQEQVDKLFALVHPKIENYWNETENIALLPTWVIDELPSADSLQLLEIIGGVNVDEVEFVIIHLQPTTP